VSLDRADALIEGGLINRTMTIRTIADFRHPRTGSTALLLSTTTELFITDLVSQHDPQANPQLACHRHTRLPHTLLHQLATIETFQLRITACGMSTGFIPKKAQQRITLFGDFSEPPASPAGASLRNEPHVAPNRCGSPKNTSGANRTSWYQYPLSRPMP